jgi:hypothetical protein
MLRKPRNVQINERYREAGTDAFGQPHRRVWRVETIYTGVDGMVYAQIAEEADGASKTIAQSVLLDRFFYLPTE